MNKIELEIRTKGFSLNLIRFLQSLPKKLPWRNPGQAAS
jgi:hypothetical protein